MTALDSMTGVIPLIVVSGVATSMVDKMGLGQKAPRVSSRRRSTGRPTKSHRVAGYETRPSKNVNDIIFGNPRSTGLF